MFSTSITQTFGLTTPIVNGGMAMIARPALAAAVCEAGGLGTIGSDINPPDVLRDLVRQTKTVTKRPFGVDLGGDFATMNTCSSVGNCQKKMAYGHSRCAVSVLIEEQVALGDRRCSPRPGICRQDVGNGRRPRLTDAVDLSVLDCP